MMTTLPPFSSVALLALGSNQGDRLVQLRRAYQRISQVAGRILASSGVYETEALVLPEMAHKENPEFLNAVIRVATDKPPIELLDLCLQIEWELGRVRDSSLRWGPRLIDIDVLSINSVVFETEKLILPHPELHKRDFVLVPLLEVDPSFRHPKLGVSAKDLLDELTDRHVLQKVALLEEDPSISETIAASS
jgi:2-amino-4-hydroxy-6-hydroxymethyldihydropteridine diphosphokinase